ncbi:MAG: VOC family protein [Microthrixaceae bacterium]
MARVESISAVTLAVTDMARSVVFYDALGFERLYGGGAEPFTSYRVGDGFVNLQLDPSWSPGPVVWGRTVFWVDDVDAMYARAIEAGLTPAMPPSDAAWGERYFHLRDPDGHELSFARPLAGG